MGMIERVNDNLSAIFDTDNLIYRRLVCDKNGSVPTVIVKPTDIDIGIIASNLEWLRLVSICLVDQMYLDRASGAFLKYQLNEFFDSLQLEDESDAQWVQRTIATVFQPKVSRAAITYALRPYSTAEPKIESGETSSGFADFSFADCYNRETFYTVYTKVNSYFQTHLNNIPELIPTLLQYVPYFQSDFGFADVFYPFPFYQIEKETVFNNESAQYEIIYPIPGIDSVNNISCLACSSTTLIALSKNGESRIKRSTDNGITWTPIEAPENNEWSAIAYGNGIFMALSQNGINNVMTSSDDGLTWELHQAPETIEFTALAYNNNTWIAVAKTGAKRIIRSTDNGVSWTEITTPINTQFTDIAFGNNTFIAIAQTGTYKCLRSTNFGITWSTDTMPEQLEYQSIAFGKNTFVAIANNGSNRIAVSLDNGGTWQNITAPSPSNYKQVVFGGNSFLAIADDGVSRIIVSDDGQTWNTIDFSETYAWQTVCYNGDFYAISAIGEIVKITNIFYEKTDNDQIVVALPAIATKMDTNYFSIKITLQNTLSSDIYTIMDILSKIIAAGISYSLVIEYT